MNRKYVSALFSFTKGRRHFFLFTLLFMGTELLLTFVAPLILTVTFDSVLGGMPMSVPAYFAAIIRWMGGPEYLRTNLYLIGILAVVIYFLRGASTVLRSYTNNIGSERSIKELRDRLYHHVQRLPFAYHAKAMTGDLIQRSTTDVDTVRRFLSGTFHEFARMVALLVVALPVMFGLHVPLTLITMSLMPFLVLTSVLFFRKIQKHYTAVETREGQMYTVIQENLTGVRVVRAFARQKFEMDKFDDSNEKLREETLELNDTFAWLWTILDLISGFQIALVILFGVYFSVRGDLTVGQFTAFSSYVFSFLWPLRNFGRIIADTSRTLVAAGRIQEILDEPEEEGLETGLTPPLSGDIVIRDLTFSYDGHTVFRNLDMAVKSGETVAILGGTGSGKSTLVQLLQRLYDYDGGSISIGGVELREIHKGYLRSNVGIVLQEPFLYSKTVLENIAIKLDSPNEDLVYEAARIASIHDDIKSFERGYDTVVGERGVTLSGGQKQRMAIARAILTDCDILVFDDSLSAVDAKTDAQIRRALKDRKAGVTTFIISHRISTLKEADRIFVLRDGQVSESGTHEELMALGGEYRRTHDIQTATAEGGE
ncbi:ABC transporter ATP-binding protein/permease [Oscillospiraceae bacterium OttesenSCG-928-G22]|nr:ABC transporter ATP-binding protein/permease [Oscillospiraceae bacterium OttesenSCG-928-G22]